MAINFPTTPTNGQTFNYLGTPYTYNSTMNAWVTTTGATLESLGDVDMTTAVVGDVLVYDGTNWVASNIEDLFAYEISHWINGTPVSSEIFLKSLFTRTVTFPQNYTGSLARVGITATNNYVVEVLKNGINVGNITFAAGVSSGVFSSSSSVTFNIGDQLALRAPIATDSTFSDPVFAIRGKMAVV